jgi:photosystem II stability/assembly factor-like uncharacterized protein
MNGQVAAEPDIALAFAATTLASGERACFAARRSGLYRSDDDGASWRPLTEALDTVSTITAVAVASADGDPMLIAGTAGGILRSPDLGESWHVVPFGSPPPLVSALAVSPAFDRDGIVLAATFEDGLYRSSDRGATWRLANLGLLDMSVLAIAISPEFADDQTVLIGATSGVYVSTTGGRSWRDLDGPETAPVVAVAISPEDAGDGRLYAGTEGAGLFESRDGGEHWRQVGPGLPDTDIVRIESGNGAAERPDLLVVTADGVFRSRIGGDDWVACAIDLAPGETIVSAMRLDERVTGADLLVGLGSGAIRRVAVR